MTETAERKIALPWYKREDYQSIRAMMADPHNLASTYEQWLASAENNENVGHQAGLKIVRVLIEPKTFSQWCAREGLSPDGTARARFASESLAQQGEIL